MRSTEAGRPAPPLKPWHVETAGGKRRLRLDFAAPMTPGVYVVAHLVPRRPLAPLATLPLPTPLDVQFAGGLLAYRAEGVEARVANSGRLRGPFGGAAGAAESKALADLWRAAGEGSLPPLPAPHALQREPGGEPFLQVALRVDPPALRGAWTSPGAWGSGRPTCATARLTAPGGDLSLVEWEVPASVVVTRASAAATGAIRSGTGRAAATACRPGSTAPRPAPRWSWTAGRSCYPTRTGRASTCRACACCRFRRCRPWCA